MKHVIIGHLGVDTVDGVNVFLQLFVIEVFFGTEVSAGLVQNGDLAGLAVDGAVRFVDGMVGDDHHGVTGGRAAIDQTIGFLQLGIGGEHGLLAVVGTDLVAVGIIRFAADILTHGQIAVVECHALGVGHGNVSTDAGPCPSQGTGTVITQSGRVLAVAAERFPSDTLQGVNAVFHLGGILKKGGVGAAGIGIGQALIDAAGLQLQTGGVVGVILGTRVGGDGIQDIRLHTPTHGAHAAHISLRRVTAGRQDGIRTGGQLGVHDDDRGQVTGDVFVVGRAGVGTIRGVGVDHGLTRRAARVVGVGGQGSQFLQRVDLLLHSVAQVEDEGSGKLLSGLLDKGHIGTKLVTIHIPGLGSILAATGFVEAQSTGIGTGGTFAATVLLAVLHDDKPGFGIHASDRVVIAELLLGVVAFRNFNGKVADGREASVPVLPETAGGVVQTITTYSISLNVIGNLELDLLAGGLGGRSDDISINDAVGALHSAGDEVHLADDGGSRLSRQSSGGQHGQNHGHGHQPCQCFVQKFCLHACLPSLLILISCVDFVWQGGARFVRELHLLTFEF